MLDADEPLRVYLDDHRAGASAGLAIARRLAERYGVEPGCTDLRRVATEIEADRDQLEAIRDHLGVESGGWKRVLALVAERSRRVKHLVPPGRQSSLSLLEELEELSAGVYAKQRLWVALETGGVPTPDGVDLALLLRRADDQLATLDALHRHVASDLLASNADG